MKTYAEAARQAERRGTPPDIDSDVASVHRSALESGPVLLGTGASSMARELLAAVRDGQSVDAALLAFELIHPAAQYDANAREASRHAPISRATPRTTPALDGAPPAQPLDASEIEPTLTPATKRADIKSSEPELEPETEQPQGEVKATEQTAKAKSEPDAALTKSARGPQPLVHGTSVSPWRLRGPVVFEVSPQRKASVKPAFGDAAPDEPAAPSQPPEFNQSVDEAIGHPPELHSGAEQPATDKTPRAVTFEAVARAEREQPPARTEAPPARTEAPAAQPEGAAALQPDVDTDKPGDVSATIPETSAVQGSDVFTDPAPATGTAPVPAPATSAGGGSGDVEAWKSAANAAARNIALPDLGPDAPRGAGMAGHAEATVTAGEQLRAELPKEAQAVLNATKRDVSELGAVSKELLESDPTGTVERVKESARTEGLPAQSLPRLQATPNGNVPNLYGDPLTPSVIDQLRKDYKLPTGSHVPDDAELARLEQKMADDEELKLEGRIAVFSGQEVSGFEPSPKFEIEPVHQQDIAAVLARVITGSEEQAKSTIDEARKTTYANASLPDAFPTIGEDWIPEEQTFLQGEMQRIAEAAGIAKETLDAEVATRQEQLAAQGAQTQQAGDKAFEDAREKVTTDFAKTQSLTESLSREWEERADQRAAVMQGNVDYKAIRARQAELESAARKIAAEWIVGYDDMNKQRAANLGQSAVAQRKAYLAAINQDRADDREKVEGDQDRLDAIDKDEKYEAWVNKAMEAVSGSVQVFNQVNDGLIQLWQTQMRAQRDDAVRELRQWADEQIGRERGFWETILNRIADWSQGQKDEAREFAKQRAGEHVAALGSNLTQLNQLRLQFGDTMNDDVKARRDMLSDEQRAVVDAYYAEGGGDTVGALAAGLKLRLSKQRRPELTKALQSAVLAKPTNDSTNATGLEKLAKMGFGVDARPIAVACKQGFNHTWGTNESMIFGALEKVPSQEVGKAVRAIYWADTGEDFDTRLKSELAGGMFDDEEEYDRAKAQLDANKVDAAAAELRIAVEGLGTDEDAVKKVLRRFQKPGEGAPDVQAVMAAYKRMYGEDLVSRLDSEMSGADYEVSLALTQKNEEKADAIELKEAQTTWRGPNKEDLETVYQRVHDEEWARGKQQKLTSEEIEKRIRNRLDKTSEEYTKEYKGRKLKDDFQQMPSTLANLAVGLQDQNWAAVDAARLEIERNGLGSDTDPEGRKFQTGAPLYADDDVINQKIIGAQYDRAYEKRQWNLELEVRKQEEEWAKTHDRPWTPEERDRRLRKANDRAAKLAQMDAQASMAAFKAEFMRTYEPGRAPSDFDSIVYSLTQGTGEEEARERIVRGGYLPPELHIEYATEGAGTDEERLKGQLRGKTKDEIEVIRQAWQARHPGENFDEMILGELSGRERFDVRMMLKYGEPQNPAEALVLAREKLAYEGATGGIRTYRDEATGEIVTYKTGIFQDLEAQVAALEGDAKAWKDAREKYPTTFVEDPKLGRVETQDPELARYDTAWRASLQGVNDVVELHRQAVDAEADLVSNIVATFVAITLAAVLAPFTAGASLAVLAAVAAAVAFASTAAMIAVKLSIKGDAYSHEELATDIAFGVVDMAVSAATAGVGGKVMRAAIAAKLAAQQGGKQASKEAIKQALKQATKQTGKQIAANVAHETAQGLFGTLVVPAIMDEYGRDLNPVLGTVVGMGLGMGGGIAMSKAIGTLGKVLPKRRAHFPEVPDLDLVDVRYQPEKLNAMQEAYLEANPGRHANDFLKDYDDLMLKQMRDESVRAKWEQQARHDLLQHVPEQHRAQFAATPVELMGDKEFRRLTGSQSKGEAVVSFKDGKPTVIVRQGASPTALRREAPHLLQSVDPKWKPHIDLLDETNLANWRSKDIREKFQLYNAKLDLELDAGLQELRQVRELSHRANPPAGIAQQIADAELTLSNLQRRKADVAKIGPLKRTLMAWGVWPEPSYLNEKPFLFDKRGDPKKPRGPPKAQPDAPSAPAGKRTIVEPYTGPNLESAVELTRQHPDADVIATEATLHPKPAEVERLRAAGGAFVPENMPHSIPVGSVDEIKMRFPIPHDRAVQQDFLRHLVDLETRFPDRPRGELMQEALDRAAHQAETATAYAPYALQRLKTDGTLEVVFWERQIIGELEDLQTLRFIDPETGKGYRFQLDPIEIRTKGEIARYSGFGVPVTNDSPVHVARLRKVELASKLPTGARGLEASGSAIGSHSGRAYYPDAAGGSVRQLDYRKVKFTSQAVAIVEHHINRFSGDADMERAMLERLRRIATGNLEATDFDRAFYTHELREYVRYRKLGWESGQPTHPDLAYALWNDVHTATLEDYRIREHGPNGEMALFHPDVVAATDPGKLVPGKSTGGRGPSLPTPVGAGTIGEAPRALGHLSDKLDAPNIKPNSAIGKKLTALRQELDGLEGQIRRGELTTPEIVRETNRLVESMKSLGEAHPELGKLRNVDASPAEWTKQVRERHAPDWAVDPVTGVFDETKLMQGLTPDQVEALARKPEPKGGETNDAVRRRRRHIAERSPKKPMPMDEWAESGFRANVNRDASSRHERAALAQLGATSNNVSGQRLEFNHAERVDRRGRPVTSKRGKQRTITTRPDGTRPNKQGGLDVIEHKHLTADTEVLHDSQQLRAQRAFAQSKKGTFELVISSDKEIGPGGPAVRPSPKVAKGGPVYYFDPKSNRVTHLWNEIISDWVPTTP